MKETLDALAIPEINLQPSEACPALAIEEACRRIPPVWPLKDYVAVNPFLGMTDQHFLQIATLFRRVGHGEIMMSNNYYLKSIEDGKITDADITQAINFARLTVPPPWSPILSDYQASSVRNNLLERPIKAENSRVFTIADFLDKSLGSQWSPFITEEISKWCSVYFDEGQSSWRMPWRKHSLFEAWLGAAQHDANPALSGLKTFPQIVRQLPHDPRLIVSKVLSILKIPIGLQTDFLHRQLFTVAGWSAYVQYRVRQDQSLGRKNNGLEELLAIRLAYDWAAWEQFKLSEGMEEAWAKKVTAMQLFDPGLDLLPRYLMLCASEKSYQRKLIAQLSDESSKKPASPARPSVQVVFCIDVRSEVYRRHLEAQDTRIKTSGFAGFFGMPIEYIPMGQRHGSAQCPVLFAPKFKVREGLSAGDEQALDTALRKLLFGQRVVHAWNAFKTSAISCFSFVETAGLAFGYKLGRDTLALGHEGDQPSSPKTRPHLECQAGHPHEHGYGMPLHAQIDLAEGALRNLGLTANFPRLVIFCGHGSSTANNPYASGLDCGACGGHSGLINARIAAGILNQKAVREALKGRGIDVPEDTHFQAAQHNTTTDDVQLADVNAVPPSHLDELAQLREWFARASQATRADRAARLGIKSEDPTLVGKIRSRSRDWSQVRPEWGLANNAALIAAPRERTSGTNLEGRTFLHDYDASTDSQSKVLELILTAPVVVANWINLQYYASTVNNRLFGSGNKTIHNVVGALGIWQGNGGDLQVGLPLQSLHNGESWMHEPLRLSVFVESPRDALNRVLEAHLEVRELVQNGWLTLFAIESEGKRVWQYVANFKWQEL